jgi:hypothetical protein
LQYDDLCQAVLVENWGLGVFESSHVFVIDAAFQMSSIRDRTRCARTSNNLVDSHGSNSLPYVYRAHVLSAWTNGVNTCCGVYASVHPPVARVAKRRCSAGVLIEGRLKFLRASPFDPHTACEIAMILILWPPTLS